MLRSQRPVLLKSVLVWGDIDLSSVDRIEVPFVLTDSFITGRLIGPFTIFQGPVDLTNSWFWGGRESDAVDLHGSIFQEDATWLNSRFGQVSPPPETTSAAESMKANFRNAKFLGAADMRGAQFYGAGDFENVAFAGRAFFQQAEFHQAATFDGATFQEKAAFIGTLFDARASFTEANATGDIDFTGSEFFGAAVFQRLSAGGLLSLNDARFGEQVVLSEASAGDLQIQDTAFQSGADLHVADIKVNALEIGLDDVERISDDSDKCRALELVERTARANGESHIANDASFRRQQIEDQLRAPPWRIMNNVVRQKIAGYLVRPLHPLFSMLAVAALAFFIRLIAAHWKSASAGTLKRTWEQRLAVAAAALGASFAPIIRLHPGVSIPAERREDLSEWLVGLGRWTEWATQKALNVTFLIALANTSPELKEIVSSIFKV